MNQFFSFVSLFSAALFLSVAAFPPLAEATEPPPDAKDVAPNHTVIIPFGYDAMQRDAQEDAAIVGNAPILRAWEGTSRINREPTLLFALWRDGTIIWSEARGKNLDTSRNNTEHFQSKITEKQVEDFLSAFDKVGFLEFSGKTAPRQISAVGPGPRFFLLETEKVQCSFTMDFVFWNGGDIVGNASRSQEHQQMSAKWKSVHELLLDLIPEKGEQISLSIESNAEKRQVVITPVPLQPVPDDPADYARQIAIQKFNEVREPLSHLEWEIVVREEPHRWVVRFERLFQQPDGSTVKAPGHHASVVIDKATNEATYFQGQ